MDYPLPTSNLSVSSVRNALGVSTTNIGVLCTSPNINMWSRRKPVRDPRINISYHEMQKGDTVKVIFLNNHWQISAISQ